MDHRKFASPCLLCLALLNLISCGPRHETAPETWFVHATDPHIFLPPEPNRDARQQANEKVVADLFRYLRSLSSPDIAPSFIAITGGFGIDPAQRKEQVDRFAHVMAGSPVKEIYAVAGEEDVPNGSGDDAAIASFGQFIDQVREKLSGSGIALHNLLACYGGAPSALEGCYEDVKDSPYRLVGFPAFGFKTEHGQATYQDYDRRLDKLKHLLDGAYQSNKQVLLLEHTPEIDDPGKLAKLTIPAAQAPTPGAPLSLSTWDVDRHVFEEWGSLLVHPALRGVFGGHLQDTHREMYREPYGWAGPSDYRLGFAKLFIVPPLAVGNQDASPLQARGFARVRLGADKIARDLYWYDPLNGSFTKDVRGGTIEAGRSAQWYAPGWWDPSAAIRWLWEQGPRNAGERTGILAIAVITAFLTIIALWQIPPPDQAVASEAKDANQALPTFSPFTSRYGQTVLAGISGLLVSEIAKTIGNQAASAESRWFYIYSFIGSFIILLVLLNLCRASTEAFRFLLNSSVKSIWTWIATGVVFSDTFFNLIQGRNQTRTRLVEEAIIKQQQSLVRGMDIARKNLAEFIHEELHRAHVNCEVYVNISLLAADRSVLYYVSRNPESVDRTFPKESIAWLAVMIAEPRWYKKSYPDDKSLVNNESKSYTGLEPRDYKLRANLQDRVKMPYKAFIVLPFPSRGRVVPARGAIHIAFATEEGFDAVWDKATADKDYSNADAMWDNAKIDPIKKRLKLCERLFDELTSGINERIFRSRLAGD